MQPNHFHFLIRIKPQHEVVNILQTRVSNLQKVGNPDSHAAAETLCKTEKRFLNNDIPLNELVVFYFKCLFQSYSLTFNKVNNRKGNLFYKQFKRVEILDDTHFTQTIIYIHANAQHHQLCKDFTTFKWSSWHTLLSLAPTMLCIDEVLNWFGGTDRFIKTHKEMTAYYYNCGVNPEDGE